MLKLAMMLVVVSSIVGASTAEAHLVSKSKPTWKLERIAKSQKKNLAHCRYVSSHGRRSIKRWHSKCVKWLKKEYKETQIALSSLLPSYGLGTLSCVECWYRVARCESTGPNWSYNGSSGFDGGLQFVPSTWTSYGGSRYAPYAYQATPMQQISIASHMSLSHWPICGSKYYG